MPDAPHLPATYAILRVYDRDGVTLRDELDCTGVSWTDELGGEGSAQYTVPFLQQHIQDNPDLLRDAIVKVAVPLAYGAEPTEIFAWFSNPGSGTLIGDAQDAARQETPASRGLMAVMDDWILLPENGFRRTSAIERFIGWMSKTGPWYNAADWDPPAHARLPSSFSVSSGGVGTHRYRCGPETDADPGYTFGPCPAGFPDDDAMWIWTTNKTDIPYHDLTLYRTTFTTSDDTLIQVYISADETFVAYLNSEQIMAGSTSEMGYKEMHTVDGYGVVVNAGTHTLAIAMSSVNNVADPPGDGADALRVAVFTLGESGGVGTLLRRSDATNWELYNTTLDGLRPGWTAAEIVIALKDEASARGISSMATLSLSFTGTTSTDSVPWPDIQERSWAIGTAGNSILSDLSETDITFDMRPDFTLDAYVTQGTDRTGAGDCPVLAQGVNLLSYTWQGQPLIATRVLIRSMEAFSFLTASAAEATYAPREAYLESGTSVSSSQAIRVATKALDNFSREHRNYTAEMIAKDGCTPYVDFFKGDTIWGLDPHGNQIPVRVMSIGGARDDEGGLVRWMLELKEPSDV